MYLLFLPHSWLCCLCLWKSNFGMLTNNQAAHSSLWSKSRDKFTWVRTNRVVNVHQRHQHFIIGIFGLQLVFVFLLCCYFRMFNMPAGRIKKINPLQNSGTMKIPMVRLKIWIWICSKEFGAHDRSRFRYIHARQFQSQFICILPFTGRLFRK